MIDFYIIDARRMVIPQKWKTASMGKLMSKHAKFEFVFQQEKLWGKMYVRH